MWPINDIFVYDENTTCHSYSSRIVIIRGVQSDVLCPTIPEVLTGQGVDKDGGVCYFKIGLELQTRCTDRYRTWGYRVKVENVGDEFLQEEYKTIEEVFVDKMPGANWEFDEDNSCWLVPFYVPANTEAMPRGYRVDVIIAANYNHYDCVAALDDGINQWKTIYQGIQFGRY